MRRVIIFIGTTVLTAAVLFSFFHERYGIIPTKSWGNALPEYHDASRPVKVALGHEFSIVMEMNEVAGLRWQLNTVWDKSLLQVVEIKHNATKTERGALKFKDIWIFRGLRQGKIAVPFVALRSGEKSAQPSEKRIFTVIIG